MLNIRVVIFISIIAVMIVLAAPRFSSITQACPLPPPQPLRTLYKQSDLIVVASVGRSVVAQRDNWHALLRTDLAVSSFHKGQATDPIIYLYHRSYDESHDIAGRYKEGDALLFFLRDRKEGDGYEVDDYNYGAKQLSDADLRIYLDRINELASILGEGKPNHEQVVEWLVRCAEEPATRWEGAWELAMSTYALQAGIDASPADGDEEAVEEEGTDGGQVAEASSGVAQEPDQELDPIFALLLTEEQKQRLAKALYNIPVAIERDTYLVDVVEAWNDPDLAKFLVGQLSQMTDNPPLLAGDFMRTLARILNDKALEGLVDEYSENASYDDLYPAEDTEENRSASEDGISAAKGRSDMLKHFLSLVAKRGTD
ncbi:MAG TPA: hypothetical protein VFM05_08005 [Candidatus Saccharimonadales bacterium]|nr:hypothetical protein [Candidatus Saccharimonadales bacterium]